MFESYFSQVVVAVSFLTCLRNFKAMSNRLSTEKRGWILKEYSKTENAAEVRKNWTLLCAVSVCGFLIKNACVYARFDKLKKRGFPLPAIAMRMYMFLGHPVF